MHYIYDYLYLSIIFLTVITIRFFTQRQFPSKRNFLFSIIIIVAYADLIFDIFSSVVIENALTLPVWITSSVCYIFYFLQSLFPMFLILYILALTKTVKFLTFPGIIPVLIPAAINVLLLATNFITNKFFYIDPLKGYKHGLYFYGLYIALFLYLILCLIIVTVRRKYILNKELLTVYLFLSVIFVFIGVQYFFPEYLVSGAAISLSITIMYIIMQKPDDMIDSITGAFNQRALNLFTQNCISENKQLYLILIEPLYMRRINRLFGMDFGNKTLQQIVSDMAKVSGGGWVFRAISNIFVLANNNLNAHEKAYESLCASFEKETDISGLRMQLTATIIALPNTEMFKNSYDLVEYLESAINLTTRGTHTVITSDAFVNDRRSETIGDALLRDIENGRINAVLQPIYSLKRNRFYSAEALARYNNEVLGNVSPVEFIKVAEKNGLIPQLDKQIIRKVCIFLQEHREFEVIQINLSPIEFISEDFCAGITETVRSYGIEPSRICFEITETSSEIETKTFAKYISTLSSDGFKFALDDYGTGYSNISRIMKMPFSLVKFDRSMMLSSMNDWRCAHIMKSTIQMLHGLSIETLVEGVETEEQVKAMIDLGVDYIQGFYYSRPMPMENIPDFINKSIHN